jgi:cupin fold WbuC family metalloprotein
MTEIKKDGILYAIHDPIETLENKNTTKWYGTSEEYIQASRLFYDRGKFFRPHRHLSNPREVEWTQECFVVVKGRIKANIYDGQDNYIDSFVMKAGDIGIFYLGGHSFEILDNDTIAFEIKPGPFTSVEQDKKFSDEK